MPGNCRETRNYPSEPHPLSAPHNFDTHSPQERRNFLLARMTEVMNLAGFSEEEKKIYISLWYEYHVITLVLFTRIWDTVLASLLSELTSKDGEVKILLIGYEQVFDALAFAFLANNSIVDFCSHNKEVFDHENLDNLESILAISLYIDGLLNENKISSWISQLFVNCSQLANSLSERNYSEVLKELHQLIAQEVQSRIRLRNTDFFFTNASNNSQEQFDMISCYASNNLLNFFENLKMLLKPGGTLHLLCTPELHQLCLDIAADNPDLSITTDYHQTAHPDSQKPGFINIFLRKAVA